MTGRQPGRARGGHPLVHSFAELATVFRSRPTRDWLRILDGHRVFEVRDYAAVAADPQNHVNGYLIETDDPQAGTPTVVGTPIRFSETITEVDPAVPELGQHTEEVFLELRYDWDEIGRLREAGAI